MIDSQRFYSSVATKWQEISLSISRYILNNLCTLESQLRWKREIKTLRKVYLLFHISKQAFLKCQFTIWMPLRHFNLYFTLSHFTCPLTYIKVQFLNLNCKGLRLLAIYLKGIKNHLRDKCNWSWSWVLRYKWWPFLKTMFKMSPRIFCSFALF